MLLREVAQSLDAEEVVRAEDPDIEVDSAAAADLLSDILATGKEQFVILTGLVRPQVIRTAQVVGALAVFLVRGKHPTQEIIGLRRPTASRSIRPRCLSLSRACASRRWRRSDERYQPHKWLFRCPRAHLHAQSARCHVARCGDRRPRQQPAGGAGSAARAPYLWHARSGQWASRGDRRLEDIISALDHGHIEERVGDWMTTNVVTIQDNMPLHRAVEFFRRYRFGRIPVLDAGGCLCGILTQADIVVRLMEELNHIAEEAARREIALLQRAGAPITQGQEVTMEFPVNAGVFDNAGIARIKAALKERHNIGGSPRGHRHYEAETNIIIHPSAAPSPPDWRGERHNQAAD